MKHNKVVFVDMDGVLADFDGGLKKYFPRIETARQMLPQDEYSKLVDSICISNPRIFAELNPLPRAIEGFTWLWHRFEVYILSTPMWCCPFSFTDKRFWVEEHLGEYAEKRLILTHNKELARGDYLIDDRIAHGVDKFTGKHLHFGTPECENWLSVLNYFSSKYH